MNRADKIVLSNVPPYDGEYELDVTYLTNRELHTIKNLCGLRAGELDDALQAGDSDVIVALAVIALERNGKGPVDANVIWDAEFGNLTFVPGEDDAGPPEVPSGSDSSSATGSTRSSTNDSAPSENDPSRTGTPASDGAASASATWGT